MIYFKAKRIFSQNAVDLLSIYIHSNGMHKLAHAVTIMQRHDNSWYVVKGYAVERQENLE